MRAAVCASPFRQWGASSSLMRPLNTSVLWRPLSALPRLAGVTTAGTPQWEKGTVKVLKPKYRLKARAMKMVIDAAHEQGYVVLRNQPPEPRPRHAPVFKSVFKEVKRLQLRKEKIEKALVGMDKRRDAMHKKDRDERYAEKKKGIHQFFVDTRAAPKPKGDTHYKRRRALGKG